MLGLSASNGCGLVPETEVAEALGMFWMRLEDYKSGGILQQIFEDKYTTTWHYTYKGRVYRVSIFRGPVGNSTLPIRLHFDYLKQESDE